MYIARKIVKQNNSNYIRTRYLAISGKLESTEKSDCNMEEIHLQRWVKTAQLLIFIANDPLYKCWFKCLES